MKVLTEMPKSGQFVAVWEFQGNVWSDTYRYDEHGGLELFVSGDEDKEEYWASEFGYINVPPDNIKFMIVGELI